MFYTDSDSLKQNKCAGGNERLEKEKQLLLDYKLIYHSTLNGVCLHYCVVSVVGLKNHGISNKRRRNSRAGTVVLGAVVVVLVVLLC